MQGPIPGNTYFPFFNARNNFVPLFEVCVAEGGDFFYVEAERDNKLRARPGQ